MDGERFFPAGVLRDDRLEPLDVSKVNEQIRFSFFSSPSSLAPSQGETSPSPDKKDAYSWLKAPRYDGTAMEVGSLARLLIAYKKNQPKSVKTILDDFLHAHSLTLSDLVSTMGRHAARAIESQIVARQCLEWIDQLVPGKPAFQDYSIPNRAEGVGLTEAPRGALGHWIQIQNGKIGRYQCVVPTTWNCSPRDDQEQPGPVEQALVGIPVTDEKNPIEVARVVRSFDPCLACAVH